MDQMKNLNSGSPTVKPASGLPSTQLASTRKGLTTDAANGVQPTPGTSSAGALAPSQMTRAEAEAKYAKLLDSLVTVMETLEAAVQAAPNTKLDIKTGVRSMGVNLRDFKGISKMLGMVRNLDAVEQRIKLLQQQQLQQHSQSLKLMSEIRAEQGNVVNATSPSQNLPQELEAVNHRLLEQGKKIDLGYSQTLQLKEQINLLLQERRQVPKQPQQQHSRR